MGDVIKQYNYKENFHKYFSEEDDDNVPLFGCEIEVDCGGENEEIASRCIELLHPIEAITKHDGSLQAGFEINIAPMSMKCYTENFFKIKEVFKFLVDKGYRAHDTKTCGLHIHVNRESFGSTLMEQSMNIAKICWLFLKFRHKVLLFARRESSYARIPRINVSDDLYEAYFQIKSHAKYASINMEHPETYEFRIFKGTLNVDILYLCLEFIETLVNIAISRSPEEIFRFTEIDFLHCFSEEIQEFIDNRREKDSNRLKVTCERVRYDPMTISMPTISDINYRYQEINRLMTSLGQNRFADIYQESQVEHQESQVEDPLEHLKRRIKSLKQQIRRARNPLKKQNLQRQYEDLQRELARERRRQRVA